MPGAWWGDQVIGVGQARRYRIGTLDLWIKCLPREWRIAHVEDREQPDRAEQLGPGPDLPPPEGAEIMRFGTHPGDEKVILRPRGADRPVVIRPDPALGLPSGESVVFYVSSPVWVEVAADVGRPMVEIPVTRPSDTWFGPSPREGELCYASRTKARLFLSELPPRPGRAITEVRVHNQGHGLIPIERVAIPMPNLSLFATEAGVLWTPSVVVTRKDQPLAEVQVDSKPSAMAGATRRVSPARRPGAPSFLFRALGALLA